MSKPAKHEIIVHKFEEQTAKRIDGRFVNGRYRREEAGSRPSDPSRVYVDYLGETILDNLNNRVARPYTTLKPIVKTILEDRGIPFTKIRWSQSAGCRMCPCSPGFIIEGNKGQDFWLTVTDKSEYPVREGL